MQFFDQILFDHRDASYAPYLSLGLATVNMIQVYPKHRKVTEVNHTGPTFDT